MKTTSLNYNKLLLNTGGELPDINSFDELVQPGVYVIEGENLASLLEVKSGDLPFEAGVSMSAVLVVVNLNRTNLQSGLIVGQSITVVDVLNNKTQTYMRTRGSGNDVLEWSSWAEMLALGETGDVKSIEELNIVTKQLQTAVEEVASQVNISTVSNYNISVLGAGMTFVKRELFLLPGHTYRFYVANPKWGKDEVTSKSATIFQIKQIVSGTEKLLTVVYKENEGGALDVKSYYDFTAVEGATYEIGLRANKGEAVQFVLHDTTDTLDHGSILYLNDERYIVPKMLAATRAAKVGTKSQTPQLVLAHFSDIHGSKTNYNRVMEFCDKYSEYINDILHTGDTVNDTYGSISWLNSKVLNCIGNHDGARYESGKLNWTSVPAVDVYKTFFEPYIASWGVVQPENAAEQGRCYYYKDYTEQGVRLITLDCMRYDDAQHAWLSQVLDNAKSAGLHVLVAVHYPLDRGTAVDTPFHSLQATTTTEADARIADVVASSGVQFIAYLCGHTHWDEFFKVKGYDGQICICVDSSAAGDNYNDAARTAGTKNQDSFNIFSVDTYGKMFRIFRVGCDRDRWMRHKGTICWDYANGKLIYQD